MNLPISTFPRINILLAFANLQLHFWDDPYQKGIWGSLIRNPNDISRLLSMTDADNLDDLCEIERMAAENWLPIALGRDILDAMTKLEEKLTQLPDEELDRDSAWLINAHMYLFGCATAIIG